MTEKCCDPNVPVERCIVCVAEAHGDWCYLPLSGWVCSEACFDECFSSK